MAGTASPRTYAELDAVANRHAHVVLNPAVEMDLFQMWQVRDGKVAVLRSFLSEPEALEAVGLRE